MRIITVLDSYPPDLNGGAYFTHRLALGLQNKGHDVLVICPSKTGKQGYSEYEGVRLYTVRSWPVLLYKNFRICVPIGIQKGIAQAIKDFNPDIMHLQGKFVLGGICYRESKKMGLPLIATNHFMPENFFHYTRLPKRFEGWFNRLCWGIITDMFDNVNVVTTPTPTAARVLAEDARFKKEVHAISCGIDLEKFNPKQDATTIRERFAIPNKPVLLYTGRLDREKKLPTVLKAFQIARKQVDAHFVSTGNGAERKALEQLAKDLGIREHCTFTGYLSDEEFPKIYGLADCFVNACPVELQSIVALEAIASGLPLLAVNAGALPELVNPGVNGYLFEPEDSQTLASYMVEILANPEKSQKMGTESRKMAQPHAMELTIAQYEALYRGISK